jgi:hypothetical protein
MYNLLKEGLGTVVERTSLSRKLTIDGMTKAYPVYKVRLDQLFYNDQNDRIATWISQYKSDHGADSFSELDRSSYNAVIEQFIIQSNEAAIEKTQMNIQLVHQREPGVILADGRIIDGNRRFTCLRRLALNDEEFNWFETVILDTDIEHGKKQIKMLELAIQHGEEKKVDYNPIDRLVGVYQDIVETELLTVEEYAYSTNETVFEVKKRVESAMLLVEFLEYIHMPKQYHIARDYQVVSVITDLQPLLRKCSTPEMREKVKNAVFANIMMRTIGDSRKYIRNLSQMMDTGFFTAYIKDQEKIGEALKEDLNEAAPEGKRDLDFFVSTHEEVAESLQMSLDRSLLKAKKHETRNRPSQIVSKSITLLKDVDTNIFEKLTDSEKENLRGQLGRLTSVVERFDTMIDSDSPVSDDTVKEEQAAPVVKTVVTNAQSKPRFFIAKKHFDEPFVNCLTVGKIITNLGFTVEFQPVQVTTDQRRCFSYRAFFIDDNNEIISDIKEIELNTDTISKATFTLSPKVSSSTHCMLALQSSKDGADELQQLIPFEVNISFTSEFDF